MSDRRQSQSVITAILVDVSGSMQGVIQRPSLERTESWSRSIIRTVDDLITNDVGPENETLALAFGTSKELKVFDLLTTLRNLPPPVRGNSAKWDKHQTVRFVVKNLQRNGAPFILSWADHDEIARNVTFSRAKILHRLLTNREFKRQFIDKCLPEKCRVGGVGNAIRRVVHNGVIPCLGCCLGPLRSQYEYVVNIDKSVMEAVKQGLDLAYKMFVSPPSPDSIYSVQEAREILQKHKQKEKLSDKELDELFTILEEYIYGLSTPLIGTLFTTMDIIRNSKCDKNILLLLSDGYPTDFSELENICFSKDDVCPHVHVVCCNITNEHIVDPKRLYSEKCDDWDFGARFLFDLSSAVATDTIPREVFRKRNWKVDTSNNATKLFFQVNNPDLIQEVCEFAKELVCEEGRLPELLSDVKEHVTSKRPAVALAEQVRDQGELNTCYAHTIANTVTHNTSNVQHRQGGYPDAEDVELDMIADHGFDGAYTAQVLEEICPQYRLQCSETPISEAQAKEAIVDRRAVVARFEYTAEQEEAFKEFFDQYPLGILNKADLPEDIDGEKFGHAVVFVGFDANGLKFLNSWGYDFADAGFFRVRNSQVLGMQFYDVRAKLTASEELAKENEGRKWARNAMNSLTTTKKAKFQCPLCDVTSLDVTQRIHRHAAQRHVSKLP